MPNDTVPQAWVALPSDEVAAVAMAATPTRAGGYDFGFVTGMGKLLRAHDRIGPAFLTLFAQIMFAPGFLGRGEREMVAAVAAAAQDCTY
ncbi:MAG: hypothetical protein ACYDA6_08600 [Solirubrobacteraceae bacterium]